MRHLILIILLSSIVTCAFGQQAKKSPIDYLVEDLSKSFLWTNGLYTPLKLPKESTFEQLTSEYLKKASFKDGRLHDYKIEEAKDCKIGRSSNEVYKIVRISSDQGGKFLIFLYDPTGWWTKNYDSKEQVQKAEAEPSASANSHQGRE